MTSKVPDYKKRTHVALVIYRQYKEGNLADVEFDAMMKALYSNLVVKSQDRERLVKFIAKYEHLIEELDNAT